MRAGAAVARACGKCCDVRDRYELSAAGEQRVLLGLAVQPVVSGLLGAALFPLVELTGRFLDGGRSADTLDGAIAFGLGAGIVGVLVTAFGAFPILMWRLKRGPIGRTDVLVAGVLLGNIPGAIVGAILAARAVWRFGGTAGVDGLAYAPLGMIRAIVFGSFVGVACAGVFWLIAGRAVGSVPASARR